MPSATVTIRSYNVGFGDSFLVELPTPAGRRARVLIDCGSLSFGDSGQSNMGLVQQIVRDVADDDGVARIDLVVATHRHKDHISGFARKEWRDVHVAEVWQPWTEDPRDVVAREFTGVQRDLARAIVDSESRLAAIPHMSAASKELVAAIAANALSNDDAIATLRTGFAGKPVRRYLARAKRPRRPRALDRLRVHVLGPTRDPDIIAKMDPPTGQGYLAMLPSASAPSETLDLSDRPFPALPQMTWQEYGTYHGGNRVIDTGQAKGQLRRLVEDNALMNAATLDHSLNNTSLMLMFEVGDQYLLFPGDSQWGTWQHAINSHWSSELLRRTTFYKIGHHGSHNASPRRFVEDLMPKNCWAVASVAPYSRWKSVPKRELLDALEAKSPGRVFTTMDPPRNPPAEVRVESNDLAIEFHLPVELP